MLFVIKFWSSFSESSVFFSIIDSQLYVLKIIPYYKFKKIEENVWEDLKPYKHYILHWQLDFRVHFTRA